MTGRLLEYFRSHANRRGLVLASEARLIENLHATRDTLVQALGALEAQGQVEILAPLPFAVLALLPRTWSGSSFLQSRKAQQIGSRAASAHTEVPVSSRAATATQREDGGVGEGEALLEEVLGTLGPEADREDFRRILAGHHPTLIHRSLTRVRATKAFRVSRAALFRSLLYRLSH